MKRAWFLGLSLALGACSDDNSVSPKTTVDAGTTMDAGSDATTDGGCPGNGVSKRPWALHVDGTSALLRWEACRPGAASSVTLTPESSGSTSTLMPTSPRLAWMICAASIRCWLLSVRRVSSSPETPASSSSAFALAGS